MEHANAEKESECDSRLPYAEYEAETIFKQPRQCEVETGSKLRDPTLK